MNWMGENWEDNAPDEDFEDSENCLDYLHRFRTIKLLQEVLDKIGKEDFVGAFVAFESIKNGGYTYNEIISTCTIKLIDRDDFIRGRGDDLGSQDGVEAEVFRGFADVIERQIGLALGVSAHAPNENYVGNEVGPNQLQQRLISEAMERSGESVVEDD